MLCCDTVKGSNYYIVLHAGACNRGPSYLWSVTQVKACILMVVLKLMIVLKISNIR